MTEYYPIQFADALERWEEHQARLRRFGERATSAELRAAAESLAKLNEIAAVLASEGRV